MAEKLESARIELEGLLGGNEVTRGLEVRLRGKHLTVSRQGESFAGSTEPDDRVRLTHLGGEVYGLSVMRHTGSWEKTPFTGTLSELVETLSTAMQHLVADW